MKITWFGHSTFRIEMGSSVLLIDPFLNGNPSFEASGASWDDAVAGTTHVALTHGHDDHIGDSAEIATKFGATLFAIFELALHLGSKGVEKLEPMGQGGTVASDDFSVTLTHAQHSSSSNGVYLGTACGLVITPKNDKTLYHMGDTDVFPGMDLINTLYQPQIGIVPIGDRFTMGARTATYACKTYFDFEKIVPCHYGTFPIIDQTADAFVAEMKSDSVVVPELGQAITV
ncbi:MAG: metal-dependent hydrolase [Hyphomicrobiaceae bacterium]